MKILESWLIVQKSMWAIGILIFLQLKYVGAQSPVPMVETIPGNNNYYGILQLTGSLNRSWDYKYRDGARDQGYRNIVVNHPWSASQGDYAISYSSGGTWQSTRISSKNCSGGALVGCSGNIGWNNSYPGYRDSGSSAISSYFASVQSEPLYFGSISYHWTAGSGDLHLPGSYNRINGSASFKLYIFQAPSQFTWAVGSSFQVPSYAKFSQGKVRAVFSLNYTYDNHQGIRFSDSVNIVERLSFGENSIPNYNAFKSQPNYTINSEYWDYQVLP